MVGKVVCDNTVDEVAGSRRSGSIALYVSLEPVEGKHRVGFSGARGTWERISRDYMTGQGSSRKDMSQAQGSEHS